MPTEQYISKIELPNGDVYHLKDAAAWSIMSTEFKVEIVNSLPDYHNMNPEELTQALRTIYLVPSDNPISGSGVENAYDEYLLLRHGDANNYTYSWELIGTTDTELLNFSEKGHVHEVTPQTQVADHTFTVSGQTPVPTFTGSPSSFTANGSVSSGAVTINIESSGDGTSYTPEGTLGGKTASNTNHTHPMGGTTKYLEKTTIYGVNSSGTSVQTAATATNTYNKVAQVADSRTTVPTVRIGPESTVTVTPATSARADGTLKNLTGEVRTNALVHDVEVDSQTETLSFILKDLNTASTVTGIASATTSANDISRGEDINFYACKNGSGVSVNSYTFGNGSVNVATVGESIDVFTGVSNTQTDTATQPIVTALNANTGNGTAHTHNLGSTATFTGTTKIFSGSIANGSVQVTGSVTPQGSNSFATGQGIFESNEVTLSHTVNNPTVTSAPDVFDEESHLLDWYGVEWKVSEGDPYKTRIGNMDMHRSLPIQTGMRRCLMKTGNADYGEVYAYLDQYDSRYYAAGSKDENGNDIGGQQAALDGTKGQVMVEIPKHWRSVAIVTKSDGYDYVQVKISPYEQANWRLINKTYIGAYEGNISDSKLSSVSGVTPTTSKSLAEFRAAAAAAVNRGCIMTYANWVELYWLYIVEYANTNFKEAYNPQLTPLGFKQGGLGDFSITETSTGNSNAAGNRTLVDSTEGIRTYRGIENFTGHNYTMLDGVKVNGQTLSATINRVNIENVGYKNIATSVPTSGGYIKEMAFYQQNTNYNGYFAPVSTTGASSSSFYCGWLYTTTPQSGDRCVYVRGADINTTKTLGFAGTDAIGTRLTFVNGMKD